MIVCTEEKTMMQYDIFGGVSEVKYEVRLKTPTMQMMFGETDGKTCKTCKHCTGHKMNRTFYKCDLWQHYFRGMSAASDIRLKDRACGKYEKE